MSSAISSVNVPFACPCVGACVAWGVSGATANWFLYIVWTVLTFWSFSTKIMAGSYILQGYMLLLDVLQSVF